MAIRRAYANHSGWATTAFAVTIEDLGAAKGYLVTQKKLSRGAKNIAAWKNMGHIQVIWNEDTGNTIILFLNQTFAQIVIKMFIPGIDPGGVCDENGVYHRPEGE